MRLSPEDPSNQLVEVPSNIRSLLWRAAGSIFAFIGFFVAWSTFAELSTTIRVPSLLNSTTPSYQVQHVSGGRVADIFVVPHQRIEKGENLIRLDTTELEIELDMTIRQIVQFDSENQIIRSALEENGKLEISIEGFEHLVDIVNEYQWHDRVIKTKLDAYAQVASSATNRRDYAKRELAALMSIMELAKERVVKEEELLKNGAVSVKVLNETRERVFKVGSEIASLERLVAKLQYEIDQAEHSAKNFINQNRLEMSKKLTNNLRKLPSLIAKKDRLTHEIAAANVQSPVSGTVTNLKLSTTDMVLRAGETIATISLPLRNPVFKLRVPPKFVDQVWAGQEGTVLFDSLQARNMPQAEIGITSISGEPVLDPDGNPLYYDAEATLNEADLAKLAEQMGDRFRLALNMPATALLKGENTTFLTFLLKPLRSLRQGAFEAS